MTINFRDYRSIHILIYKVQNKIVCCGYNKSFIYLSLMHRIKWQNFVIFASLINGGFNNIDIELSDW